ncbi:extracellular solute-binding protein [Lapidilactobacillus dextrinicus]|uniref:extracellular solute-binding protein n=1 Tax=Lapidilactobacillus dextrinicus TaxID=51664 RepID=UPI0022E31CBF|nr:extracellular solute-binding protein [Lapidilactobacillus dextrinicus]
MKKWHLSLKRKLAIFGTAALASLLLVGCSSNSSSSGKTVTKANTGMKVIGDHIKYDPNKKVNDGKPITIEYWTWNQSDATIKMAKQYHKLYPNVKIKVVQNDWDNYWKKLPLAIKGGTGPAIFNIHNSFDSTIKPYLAPYKISTKNLEADYNGVEPHVQNGKVYYTDYSINTGNIYYNKKLWKEAGLTDNDIPKTWDQLIAVAKKMTKFKDGKMTQAGFNINQETYSAMIFGLNYQKGQLLFSKNGKKLEFDNKVTVENTNFLQEMYTKDKIGSADFGTDSTKSFGNGQSAMVYKWGWFQGELNTNYSKLDYGVFPTPSFTEKTPFAYDRYNGESTPGINNKASKEQQAVAQDFLRYLLAGDEWTKEFSLANTCYPMKKSLADDKDIKANKTLAAMATHLDRYIWPGSFPSTIETNATKAFEDIMYNKKPVEQSIKQAQKKATSDMKETPFTSVESKYKFYDELNK